VFKHLGPNDLCRAALICKAWRKAVDDPLLWRDFPVNLANVNSATSFLGIKRLAKVRSLEIVLPGCNLVSCEVHPEKEWPVLERIYNHLGTNLENVVFRLSCCLPDTSPAEKRWIDTFIEGKMKQGINHCCIWAHLPLLPGPGQSGGGGPVVFNYYWAATSDTSLLSLIRKTLGRRHPSISPSIRLLGLPGHRMPPNVMEMLRKLAKGSFHLATNIKIHRMDNLDIQAGYRHGLMGCQVLELLNKEAIEDEEVSTMKAILAYRAKNGMPFQIKLPKALFLRTTRAEPERVQRSKQVTDCKTIGKCPLGHCPGLLTVDPACGGCVTLGRGA